MQNRSHKDKHIPYKAVHMKNEKLEDKQLEIEKQISSKDLSNLSLYVHQPTSQNLSLNL